MNLVSPYPWWFYVLCLVFGIVCSFLLYRKDKKLIEFSKLSILILFILRFVGISALAILLLSPLIQYFNKTVEKPILIIAQDHSSSMVMAKDSSFVKSQLQNELTELERQLNEKYEVDRYIFSSAVEKYKDSLNYTGKITNFELLHTEIENKYANRNVGGLILVSDGIYNQGINPQYAYNSSTFPILAIGTGDTTTYVDLKIKNLRTNKLTFLGNKFPVKFDIIAQKIDLRKVNYTISYKGKIIENKTINIRNNITTVTTEIEAKEVGQQRYDVKLEILKEERNQPNNSTTFYIDVVDGRQKIALLGIAPHPDLNALKQAIVINDNYEIETGLYSTVDYDLDDYDLIILHQAANAKDFSVNTSLNPILNLNKPLLLVGGGWSTLNQQFGTTTKLGNQNLITEAQALLNTTFSLFTIPESFKKLQNYPPLVVSHEQVINSNPNTTLLYRKIGSVKTDYPLISFQEYKSRKIGHFSAEGFWKWRLNDYSTNENFEITNDLINKVVQFLALKADRNFFRVSTVPSVFENEPVVFSAQLFNPSYELINNEEVKLILNHSNGEQYTGIFSATSNAYQLTLNALPIGEYTYKATTTLNGKLLEDKGYLTIQALQLEGLETTANHNVLYQIAEASNGKFLTPNEIGSIPSYLDQRDDITAVSYIDERVEELINLKWIFYLILFIFSLEWLIRKRGGAY